MHIIIKDGNLINHFSLNKDSINYKGINIYFNNAYYISLDNNLSFKDNTKIKELKEEKYKIKDERTFYNIEVYVYLEYTNKYSLYKNNDFLFAHDQNATIVCKDKYLKSYYLYCKKGHLRSNFNGLLLNHKEYKEELLKDGDFIEMLSFSFYYQKDFLYIIDNYKENKLEKYYPLTQTFKYQNNLLTMHNYLPELVLDDIKLEKIEDIKFKEKNKHSIITQIIPSLTISISMFLIGYLNYISNHGSIIYLLMPLSMILSSVIIPIIIRLIDNRKLNKDNKKIKENYLSYLKNYHNSLLEIVKKHETYNESKIFKLNNYNHLFSINKDSIHYLKLYLGYYTKYLDISYSYSLDKDIDNYLDKIKDNALISNELIFLDLNKTRVNTIVCEEIYKEDIFHKLLLTLASSHNYNDLNIGVYLKENNNLDYLYNLPHLFINKLRLTLNSLKDLQEIDQMKLAKPLVLFIKEDINYKFENKDIIVIYFSDSINKIYSDSKAVISFKKKNAILYEDKQISFSYFIEDSNYYNHYKVLGLYNNLLKRKKEYLFKDIFSINDIRNNYLNNFNNLKACFSINNEEPFTLDLHEDKAGPHGLIGGSTGSGKSELIISLLLSLVLNYSPTYLNIILIDYKGGGIKESLSYNGKSIPHIVASLSNLEKGNFERLLLSIKNECQNREELFKELSSISKQPIFDLDTYMLKHQNYNFKMIPHLLIVVDEFAELKKEHPSYIKELISISRIGRSLGIHLLLATQKPGGNIDEEIWSNSHFKIALKTLEESDSLDIIKSKDASYLKEKGEYYLLLDNSLIKAKSIYSKNDYFQNESYNISLLDNKLHYLKSISIDNKESYLECNYFSKKIINICKELNLNIKKINYEAREPIDIDISSYPHKFIIGQNDDYYNQEFNLIEIKINENILIYSSRNNEINYYLNVLDYYKRNIILISDKEYKYQYISDLIKYDEDEDIEYLFNYLLNNKLKNITLIIENINELLSYNETYLDKLIQIIKRRNSDDYNIIILSSISNISFKLLNYFKHRVAIEIDNSNDIYNLFNKASKYIGNSYYLKETPISFIPNNIQDSKKEDSISKPIIKRIPEIINSQRINNSYLIGYDKKTREEIYLDNNYELLITSLSDEYLNYYKDYSYPRINYHKLNNKNHNNILWLGEGIFRQQLFLPLINKDISKEEAYLIYEGKHKIIRRINNA